MDFIANGYCFEKILNWLLTGRRLLWAAAVIMVLIAGAW
jgi:hypothetical protein